MSTPPQARHLPFDWRQETRRELSHPHHQFFKETGNLSRGFPTRASLMSFRDRLRNQILVCSFHCFIKIVEGSVINTIIHVVKLFVNHCDIEVSNNLIIVVKFFDDSHLNRIHSIQRVTLTPPVLLKSLRDYHRLTLFPDTNSVWLFHLIPF